MDLNGRNAVVTGGRGRARHRRRGAAAGSRRDMPRPGPGRKRSSGALLPMPGNERVRLVCRRRPGGLGARSSGSISGIDGLWASIHLAGGFDMGGIDEVPPDMFQRQVSMNAATCYLCCRAAIAGMRRTGDGGRIVNVSARPGLEPRSGGGMVAGRR